MIEKLWEQMWWKTHYSGHGGAAVFAISAVDIGLWDMKSRKADSPLWVLLGGYSDRVKACPGGIDLYLPLDDLIRQAETHVKSGYSAIKMKVGRKQLSKDVERVGAVRDAIPSEMRLMLDANMVWDAEEAIRFARQVEDVDIYWLEEPTIPEDIPCMKRVASEGGIAIAAVENLRSLWEFNNAIQGGGISFPQPDVTNVGGITPWLKVAHTAQSNNLKVTSHGAHDLHVHLLAAVPNSSYLEIHGFGLERYFTRHLEISDGDALCPNQPGHGIAFKWGSLKPFKR